MRRRIWILRGGDFVDQGGDDRFGVGRLQGLEGGEGGLADVGGEGLQGGDQVADEAGGVVVPRFEGEPRVGTLIPREPGRDEGGFAKPGRGGDQRQFAPFGGEFSGQPGPRDEVGAKLGGMEFGREQGHGVIIMNPRLKF
ncbi:MAG: hypothetical protein HUU38_13540 [Anaerolineales bacterium]|nr:hypothetical protein [Anaerolineales bacterium]